MSSPSRSSSIRALLLLSAITLLGAHTASGQDSLLLSAGSQTLELAPGSVGSRPVVISNEGDVPVSIRLRPQLPPGWSVLIPPPSVVVPAGGRVTQLLTFTVPTNEASGTYEIVLSTEEDGADPLRLSVTVPSRPRVTAEWLDGQDLVRAGGRIDASLRITNAGNAATTWVVDARSSLNLPLEVRPSMLTLQAGESGSVRVQVSTKDDITTRLTHALSVTVATESGDARTQISTSTDIYPTRAAERARREDRLPAFLTATAASEDGEYSGQVELRVPETVVGNRVVDVLLRAPDARQVSTFSQPDRYSLRVGSPDWMVRLGDQTWEATDLLDVGSLGFGAGGEVTSGRITRGGFVHRSRRIFPEQQQAFVFVGAQLTDDLQVRVNGLAKRSFEEGESASVGVLYEPGNQTVEAEVAHGWFEGETGRAAQVSVDLQQGRTLFSAQAEAADDAFLGAIRGARGGSVSTQVALTDWLRISGQTRVRQRRYDLGAAGQAEQTFGLARTVLTMLRSRDRYRVSWTLAAQGQLNNNNLNDLRREERAYESRVTLNRRRFGTSFQVRRGQSQDAAVADLPHYLSTQATLFASRRSWSINVSGTWLDGPTFYNPVSQERISLGVNMGWDGGSGTQVVLSGLHSEDRLRSNQSFSMADLRFQHLFAFGHQVTLRARTVRTAFTDAIRNGSVSLAWTVPLGLPIPGRASARNELTGRVVDAETGQPVAHAVVQMGNETVATDVDGRFVLRSPAEGTGYLTIERGSLGFDRRPIPAMPMLIDLAQIPEEGIQIDVIRSAEMALQVTVDTGTGGRRQSALNTNLTEADRAGVLVEIRSAHGRLRRITDREGRVAFADLVPGPWQAFIVGGSLPEGTVSRPDTLGLTLEPGGTGTGDLTIAPERREVRLVGSGGISLVGGIRPVESVSVSVVREGDDAQDASPVSEGDDRVESPGDARDTSPRTHTVREGDSLARLARRYYGGSTLHWIRLWQANAEVIGNPDIIRPGSTLIVPEAGPLTEAEKAALVQWSQQQ